MDEFRKEIDLIDRQILSLFEERLKLSGEIAEYKKFHAIPIYDAEREASKLDEIKRAVSEDCSSYACSLYERIFDLSRGYQSKLFETDSRNIVIVGMPGSGKSTLAKELCQISERKFVDTDILVEELADMSIEKIFSTKGEAEFRRLETKVLEAVSRQDRLVVASGGGCVTVRENHALLCKNSFIVWLKRDIDKLERGNRPLSFKADLNEMYARRAPLYELISDISEYNDSTPREAAERIWRKFNEAIGN